MTSGQMFVPTLLKDRVFTEPTRRAAPAFHLQSVRILGAILFNGLQIISASTDAGTIQLANYRQRSTWLGQAITAFV
jgi:hypothetical protein